MINNPALTVQFFDGLFNGGAFWRSAIPRSCQVVNFPSLYSNSSAPSCQVHRFPIYYNHPVVSFVTALLPPSGPATVPRLIVSIIVNAINRMKGRWPIPHICKKILETLHPPIANFYSPSSVVRVLGGVNVVASISDGHPCAVNRCKTFTMGDAARVPFHRCNRGLAFETPATKFAFAEVCSGTCGYIAAIATAKPKNVSRAFLRRESFYYSKASKFLACQAKHPHSPMAEFKIARNLGAVN